MTKPAGDDSKSSEPKHYFDGYTLVPYEERELSPEALKEQEIQVRMLREAQRAVREEIEWCEEHNFPVWIIHEGEVIDARTLPPDVRAANRAEAEAIDLTRPKFELRRLDPSPDEGV